MVLSTSNTVQQNVSWVNQLIGESGWDRVLALAFLFSLAIFFIGLWKRWITIGKSRVEEILTEQLTAANLSLQARDTDTLNEINKKQEAIKTQLETIQTMLVNATDYNKETAPLIRGVASEVGNISDEIRDLARRGGGRGVI